MLQIDMQTNVKCRNSLKCDIIKNVYDVGKSCVIHCHLQIRHAQVRITFVSHV